MTFQQIAIEFFTTTEKKDRGKNQIVEKLMVLAEDYPMDQGPNQYTRTHLAERIANHDRILDRIGQRLAVLETPTNHLKPEISSPPDDDAPF